MNKWSGVTVTVNNRRHHERIHNFGCEAPKTVTSALQIDKENDDNQQAKARRMSQKFGKISIAIDVMENGVRAPAGHTCTGICVTFDAEMENH